VTLRVISAVLSRLLARPLCLQLLLRERRSGAMSSHVRMCKTATRRRNRACGVLTRHVPRYVLEARGRGLFMRGALVSRSIRVGLGLFPGVYAFPFGQTSHAQIACCCVNAKTGALVLDSGVISAAVHNPLNPNGATRPIEADRQSARCRELTECEVLTGRDPQGIALKTRCSMSSWSGQ